MAPALVAGAGLFTLIATCNAGGYQYGVSDQAFYIPAILQDLNPALFPHDRALLAVQEGFLLFDEVMARAVQLTGWSLQTIFLLGYVVGALLLWTGIVVVGRTFYATWWGVAALGLALTLRHRITKTGVNTFESYFHPRMIVFAAGVIAVGLFLRGRTWLALAFVALFGLLHPTTALWFVLWIGCAAVVVERPSRTVLAALFTATALVALWAVAFGPLRGSLVPMDGAWTQVLAGKDYVFPDDWPLSAWAINLGYAAVLVVLYRTKTAACGPAPREYGLVVGALALMGGFLLCVPFIALRIALVVQLQVSRIFWLLDFLAIAYTVWWLVERPVAGRRWRVAVAGAPFVAVLAAFAVGRGVYVGFFEGEPRDIVEVDVPVSPWRQVMDWTARTPVDTNLLADPGHGWRYGSSVRVSGQRDVFLEEVKDSAMAIYSRDVAERVHRRISDLGNFSELTPSRARSLARTYDLDYLVTERALDLPVAFRAGEFTVYDLR